MVHETRRASARMSMNKKKVFLLAVKLFMKLFELLTRNHPPEAPEDRPFFNFLILFNIECVKVFRAFSGSSEIHILKPKDD